MDDAQGASEQGTPRDGIAASVWQTLGSGSFPDSAITAVYMLPISTSDIYQLHVVRQPDGVRWLLEKLENI